MQCGAAYRSHVRWLMVSRSFGEMDGACSAMRRVAVGGAEATSDESKAKRALLEHLRRSAFVKLAPSAVEGVGVFAIRDIPANTNPFEACNRYLCGREEFISVTADELLQLPPAVRSLVRSFFAPLDNNGQQAVDVPRNENDLVYGVNATGVNTLDLSWYLNHSDTPSVRFVDADSVGSFNSYETTREVKAGEELFVDYRELGVEYYMHATGSAPAASNSDRASQLALAEEALEHARLRRLQAEEDERRLKHRVESLRSPTS